jgi:hypothetical protein
MLLWAATPLALVISMSGNSTCSPIEVAGAIEAFAHSVSSVCAQSSYFSACMADLGLSNRLEPDGFDYLGHSAATLLVQPVLLFKLAPTTDSYVLLRGAECDGSAGPVCSRDRF